MKYGTSHFVSQKKAELYYREQGYVDSVSAVKELLKEGNIKIGPPSIKENQKLSLNGEGRYLIQEM